MLANPEVLVMDEATSSVDTVTEALIQQGMERVMAGRTTFVIAHRLSTINRASRILVVENGRVAEQGTHAELLRAHGHYYKLYTQQFHQERPQRMRRWNWQGWWGPRSAVAPVLRQMWTLSLVFGHRLVDGTPAVRFLQYIKGLIEEPYLLLAE